MKNIKDFPSTLILQRKYIAQIPNGDKIAVYYNDKLKKYFSILPSDLPSIKNEEFFEDDFLNIEFNDGSSLELSTESIRNIYSYLNSINNEERKILEDYIQESSNNFLEILELYTKQD